MTTYEAQWMTAGFILLMILSTVTYDLWVMQAFGSDATISRVCGVAFQRYPVVFAWLLIGVGIYLGHVHLSAWR